MCNELKLFNKPKITDILFYLFDLSGKARENLVNLIISIKRKTLKDSKSHNFSMPPDYHYFPRVGISYVSLNSNNDIELKNKLMTLCQVRKYKSKGDVWIGFGSLKDSTKMIDGILFNDEKWIYNKELDKITKEYFKGGQGKMMRIGKKIGRNDKCPCGSGLKYKNCCGKI